MKIVFLNLNLFYHTFIWRFNGFIPIYFLRYCTVEPTELNSICISWYKCFFINERNRIYLKIIRDIIYFYSFHLCNEMQNKQRKIPADILYKTYSTRCHFVQCLIIDLKFYYQSRSTKISLFVLNSRNGIIDSQRDPAARKRDLLTRLPPQVPYPFSLVAHLSREIVFFFFLVMSSPIDGRSVDLCVTAVEILFNGIYPLKF